MECPEQSLTSVRSDHPSISANYAAQHRKAKRHGRQVPSTLNGAGHTDGLVPVILSTDRLLFSREQRLTENTLTLYNPFDFEICYKCKWIIFDGVIRVIFCVCSVYNSSEEVHS